MEKIDKAVEAWESSNILVFWGEIAPCDHVVQFYENDTVFLNTLEGFVGNGLISDESVIIIATDHHLNSLHERLTKQGFNIDDLTKAEQYIPINAHEALSKFMVDDWPDDTLFEQYITQVINIATKNNKKVRAFGEMVAILWHEGFNGATVRLEYLWNKLHARQNFSLYCAYPKNGFTQSAGQSLSTICAAHSKVIDGNFRPSTEIYYRASH